MVIKLLSAALVLASGFLAGLAAIQVMFGVAGGDIWHRDFLSPYWWTVPIAVLILDILLILYLQRILSVHFNLLDYVLFLVVPFIMGLGLFLFWLSIVG